MRTIFSQVETFFFLIVIIIPILIFTVVLFRNLWKSNRQVIKYLLFYFLANIIFVILNLLLFSFVESRNTYNYNFEFLPKGLAETIGFILIFAFLTSTVLVLPLAGLFFFIVGLGFITGNRFITATERKFEMSETLWSKLAERGNKLSRSAEMWSGLIMFLAGFSLLAISLSEGYKFYCNELRLQTNCNESIFVKLGDFVVRTNKYLDKFL